MSGFIHLHTHSHYSLLDGLSNIDEMVVLAKKYGMPALGLTDHGALYGAIHFYKKCIKEGIKPIVGVEAYIANGSRFDKQPGVDNKRFHLTLLAKNNAGYKNLVKLTSLAHLEGYYYKPRVDKELLKEYSEGIICLSGCLASELSRALANKNFEHAESIIHEYQEIFGKDNYFLEIMHHPNVPDLPFVRRATIELSQKYKIPLVATQDSHYLHPEDHKAHETLLAVQQNTDLGDTKRLTFSGNDFSFINTKDALKNFNDIPEAVENTYRIADQCNLEIPLGNWIFPDYKTATGATHDKELESLTREGLLFRNIKKTDEVEKRIAYELGIIGEKKFSPYFLVVADLLRFARTNDILTNTRGSAAGSLVSYLLGITNVNPIEFKLPFERFLNPERPSAPDIDMDFADNRRDEVIAYAKQKYGEDKVAQIGTFGTMMARGAVRDVARALGYPYATGDKISKLIPMGSQGFPMTIDRAMEITPELKELYEKDAEAREILDLSKRLEGTVRHISVHAAGVVISPTPLMELVPLQFDPKGGKMITQYDMHGIEDIGLLKLDFLGIRNLTILGDSVKLVKQYHEKDIDIDTIPLDNAKTFNMLAHGETMGLFQLNGSGMTRYLKDMEPSCIEDINAMIALYRPGPMAFIPDYIKRKENPELVTYVDERLRKILESTYGILIYQDDILLIATQIAGYSWGEADTFRKAVGKKIPKEMQAQKDHFTRGCIKNGMAEDKVKQLWEMIETFAAYGFNKAHAASYGKVAYQTAFMKANFPTEYMAAVLTAESGDVEKIAEIITECTRMNIPVLPPDVNESFSDFTIIKGLRQSASSLPAAPATQAGPRESAGANHDQIRFGLRSVKNLGEEIASAVIDEREHNGKFISYANFLERVHHRNLNKKSLEALIKCGAMDNLGERGKLYAHIEEALAHNKESEGSGANQASLFGLMKDQTTLPVLRLKETDPLPQETKLTWEKELLGLYVSGHPLEKHRKRLAALDMPIQKIKKFGDGIPAVFGGIIEEAKTILTHKGEQMAFVKVSDFTDSIETIVFPRVFAETKDLLRADKNVLLKGKMSWRNGAPSVIIEKVKEL